MDELKFTFPIGSKVQLKFDYGDVYTRAWGGSLGYVRDTKIDDYGFEKIFVEWDHSDWRYNSQQNGWTYVEHFSLKEPPPAVTKKPAKRGKMLSIDPKLDAFMEELQRGIEAASGSEGFAIFIARRVPVPDQPNQTMIVPEVFAASHNGEADAVLGITMSEHLSGTFQDMTMLLLEMYGEDDSDGEKPSL